MRSFIPWLGTLAILGGCGPEVRAPSLSPRPVEQQPITVPAQTSEAPSVADPTLPGRIGPIVQAARDGHKAFALALHRADVAVAAAADAPRDSELWTVAQQAISALDAAQSPVRDAAARVEDLRQDPANAGAANRGIVADAGAAIDALQAEETSAAAALAGRLK